MSAALNLAFRRTKEAVYWSSIIGEPLAVLFFMLRPILVRDLRATTFQLALFMVLKHAIALISVYGSLWALGKRERLKPQMLWTGMVMRVPFLFFAWVHNPWWALAAVGINMLFGKAGTPAWLEMMRLNLPKEERTRIFAWSSAISVLEGLFLAYFVKILFQNHPSSWRVLFPLCAAFGMTALWWIWRIPVPAVDEGGEELNRSLSQSQEHPSFADLMEFAGVAIRDNILQFVSFVALLICAASPFLKFSGTRVIYLYPPSQYIVAFFTIASGLQLATWIYQSEFILRPWKTALRLISSRPDFRTFQIGYFICGGGILLFQPVLTAFCIDELDIKGWRALTDIFLIYSSIGYAASMQLWNRSLRLGLFQASTILCLCFAMHIALLIAAAHWHGHQFYGMSASLIFIYSAQVVYGISGGGSHFLWNMSATLFCREKEDSSLYTTTNMLIFGVRAITLSFFGAYLSHKIGHLNLLYVSGTCCLIGAAVLALGRNALENAAKPLVKK